MSILRMSAAARKAASLVGGPTPYGEINWCLRWCVRHVYNFWGACRWGGNGRAWAINYWYAAKNWGRVVETSDPHKIPAGAMTFSKGAPKYGHVFIADGKGGCYTTDYPRSRKIGHVPIDQLMRAWGQRLLGYIEVTGEGFDLRDSVAPVASASDSPTVFDVSFWNVASPRWYTAWGPRAKGIAVEITGDEVGTEASVHTFAEVYSETQAATIRNALGRGFVRVSGRAGLELFYDASKWRLERKVHEGGYLSRIQGRYALVVHLERIDTGQHVAFVLTHGPVQSDSLKAAFGRWHARLLSQVDGPIVALGDYNRNTKSPRSEMERLGYRDMREQAPIINESSDEFPSRGWNLSDIYTIPSKARITGGEIDHTSARLSDHRRIEARVVIP